MQVCVLLLFAWWCKYSSALPTFLLVHYEISVFVSISQFQQMLMHRAQKRMQNSLSLHEISPHLAAISSSCITMPGHNQGDEVSMHKLKRCDFKCIQLVSLTTQSNLLAPVSLVKCAR